MIPMTTSNVLTLEQSDPLELLTHMAAYGFAAIVEATTSPPPTLSWTSGMEPRLCIEHESLDVQGMAKQIRYHAERLSDTKAWPHETWTTKRTTKRPKSDIQQESEIQQGLMSPRISKIKQQEPWKDLQQRRHTVLDALVNDDAWLDLRFLWSLGEPCYWTNSKDGGQDAAASQLDLQPRNRGAEIIGTRIAKLAEHVSKRTPDQIVDAFRGTYLKDTIGEKDGSASCSAVGFRGHGPVDDVVSWCAIWGISQFALNRSLRNTTTASCMIHRGQEWVCVPVWDGRWAPARLRTILASSQLQATARACLSAGDTDGSGDAVGFDRVNWLLARGVNALILFQLKADTNSKAGARHAQRGTIYDLRHPGG
jgi:CRISPR-associated protein Csb3